MNSSELLSKLNDIKELEKIPDNSFFIFLALVLVFMILLILIIFSLIKFIKNKKPNQKKVYYKILEDINFENPKEFAYTFTKYSKFLISNDREKKLANELIEELEKYKYKKVVENLDEEIKAKYKIFMESLDV